MLVDPKKNPEAAALDVATVSPAFVGVTLPDVPDGVVGVDDATLDVAVGNGDEEEEGIGVVEGNDKDLAFATESWRQFVTCSSFRNGIHKKRKQESDSPQSENPLRDGNWALLVGVTDKLWLVVVVLPSAETVELVVSGGGTRETPAAALVA
ncbi:hypothetical protein C0992_003076 [Termitomyces sp. T32_za158]|nr:hypothetical protein C0992_003076 [Termitomyces sp. T32_za158]